MIFANKIIRKTVKVPIIIFLKDGLMEKISQYQKKIKMQLS